MAENIVKKKFESNTSNSFTVLRKSNEKQHREFLYEIEFEEINGIKHKRLAKRKNIIAGEVKNPYYPVIYGVGYLGNTSKKGNDYIYSRWKSMLKRCYEPNHDNYRWYGAKGVSVDKRWHCFENFLNDFFLIDGYDENNIKNLHLDKDIKIPGNKIYSLKACKFVSANENLKDMNERKYYQC